MKVNWYLIGGVVLGLIFGFTILLIQKNHQQTEDLLRKEWQQDKKETDLQVQQKQAEILSITERYKAISKKMKDDSIRYSDAYNALKIEKARLNKRLNEINLKNSTIVQLDSIRRALYGSADALHSN